MTHLRPTLVVADRPRRRGRAAPRADINVGVTVSATGPAASLGIPEKNTIALMPKTIGGQKVNYIVLDDASDTTTAVANTRKLITESKVDIVLGSTTTPNSLAMIDVVAEAQTPMISMAASARIVEPVDAKRRWVFKTPQNDIMMSLAIATHMASAGVKTVGFIGFADAYGEGWFQEFSKVAGGQGADDRRQRALRAHRHLGHRPGAEARRGQARRGADRRLGHAGRAAAADAEGARLRRQVLPDPRRRQQRLPARRRQGRRRHLPAGRPGAGGGAAAGDHPVAKSALDYVAKYEAAYGKGSVSTFGAHAWDAGLLMSAPRPQALKKAQPGTPEFRAALRDALERSSEVPGAHGIFNMSPTDHLGLDQRARVMVKIENGAWKYQP